jgi:hypothetical protein
MVIKDMQESKILASLTAAQAFIESNKGNSGLTVQCNNLFGIKGAYNGQSGIFWTTEYYNGVKKRVQAAFKKYPSWQESIDDHSAMFNRMARYKNLRGETDYQKACIYVKQDGYATSPTYTNTLFTTINRLKLYAWDAEALGKPVPVHAPAMTSEVKKAIALPTLKKGCRSDYVLHWQKFLNLNGYFCGLEDGKFGANTEEAVKAFQLGKGLTPDGIIGGKTWASIGLTA